MRRTAVFLLLLVAALLASASPAAATVEEVVDGLRAERLYVAPGSAISPDRDAVLSALDETAVTAYVAIVSQADVDAEELGIDGLLLQVVDRLAEPEAVVLLVTDGQELQARDGGASGADPVVALDEVIEARLSEPFTPENLTGAIVDFVDAVSRGAQAPPPAAGGTRRTVGLIGLVAVAALGGGGWLYARSQRRVLASAPLTSEPRGEGDAGWPGAHSSGRGTMGS